MARKRKSGKAEFEGLICWVDDDPYAEVSLVTDGGQELMIEPGGPIDDPSRWVDAYVHVRGRFTSRDDRQYLRVERVERIQDDWDYRPLPEESFDWRGDDPPWDDGEEEYEDYH